MPFWEGVEYAPEPGNPVSAETQAALSAACVFCLQNRGGSEKYDFK